MQEYFYDLADLTTSLLQGSEVALCNLTGEDSDFVRFNHSTVRQAGAVTQRYLEIDLILGQRHTSGDITVSGDFELDRLRIAGLVQRLRERLSHVPEDPFLLYATAGRSTERLASNRLPEDGARIVDAITGAGKGHDLVGIYASGAIYRGFANSLGQRNWASTYSYHFDWSFYLAGDKAVKDSYAGFVWDPQDFQRKIEDASEQLKVLSFAPRAVGPGRYRVYLAPAALAEITDLLRWGGFGLRHHRTRQTPLLRLVTEEASLNPAITLVENTAEGVGANFEGSGFIKPDRVTLIKNGVLGELLVSPRSEKEFDVATNGADSGEAPHALDMAGGGLPLRRILEELQTGIYVNNLWYLNYSDRSACRITGMTRFATFWVENGTIQAPLSVMRFDDTLYRMLGKNLAGLTVERDLILDGNSYHSRSTRTSRLPGVLIDDFILTL